jgi:hypothetical protein
LLPFTLQARLPHDLPATIALDLLRWSRTIVAMRRSTWRLASVGIVAVSLLVALHLYLNSGQVRDWALSRIKKELVNQFGDVVLGDGFSVDWVGRVTTGPLILRDERGMLLTVASVTVRLAYRRLLTGQVVPAAITLDKVDIDLDRAKETLERLLDSRSSKSHGHTQSEQRAPLDVGIRANDIHFKTRRAGLMRFLDVLDPLSGRFAVQKSGSDLTMTGKLQFHGDGQSNFDVKITSDGTATLNMNSIASRLDRMLETDDLPFTIKDGELSVDVNVDAEQNFRRGTAVWSAKIRKLQLEGERLDSNSVGPLDLTGGATAQWDRATKQIQLTKSEVGISGYTPLPLDITGRLELGLQPSVDIDARIRKLDFPRFLHALPPELLPGGDVPETTGVIGAQFRLKGPAFQADKLELTSKLDLSGLRALQTSSATLTNSFEYRPATEHGPAPTILVGENNPNFVPVASIPPFLIGAVLLSEDASFWGHRGFDFQEIKESLVDAAEEKRFRGASTITQQLAKNLYFSREKTYARKIREAIATLSLEASLSKSRILEIYFNIIEWGPGIYGVGQAAQHYFGRDVRDLTPKQAAFLATIIPNPIKYYVYYRQGALSEVWETRVHELLLKMRDRGVLNEDEFLQAEATPIVFASTKGADN